METYKENSRAGMLLLFAAIATKPLYLWKSGYPQISDMLIVLFALMIILESPKLNLSVIQSKWMTVFIFTIIYQVIVNTVCEVIANYKGFEGTNINYSLYYVFNFLVSLVVFMAYNTYGYEKLEKLYINATIASCIICVIGVIINYKSVGRQTGFFNNPNQLGYYSIIVLTVMLFFKNSVPKVWYVIIIVISLVLNALSLSKASILAAVILLVVNSLISNTISIRGLAKLIVQMVIILVAVYMIMFSSIPIIQNNRVIQSLRYRIVNMSNESDANMGTGRGYDRIEEVGTDIITGVGEGFYKRFEIMYDHEIHSMYASILVCYGVFGALGYCYLLYVPLRGRRKPIIDIKYLALFSGVLLYSFTHNSIRNTLLWVLLSMIMVRDLDMELHTEGNNESDGLIEQ